MQITYHNELISRYVLLNDQAALHTIERDLPFKYHFSRFANEKAIFIPLLDRLNDATASPEYLNLAADLLKENRRRNQLFEQLISDVFPKLENPILISNFGESLRGTYSNLERYHEFLSIYMTRAALVDGYQNLQAAGWELCQGTLELSLRFANRVRLRYYDLPLLELRCDFHGESVFRPNLSQLSIGKFKVSGICPSLSLFVSCTDNPSCTWIIDAVTIINQNEIEWPLVIDAASHFGRIHHLLLTLTYLTEKFAANIPNTVIEELKARRRSIPEFFISPWTKSRKQSAARQFLNILGEFIRIRRENGLGLLEFPAFVNYSAK